MYKDALVAGLKNPKAAADLIKATGSSVSEASTGMGAATSTAATGIGTGVSTAATGIGEGVKSYKEGDAIQAEAYGRADASRTLATGQAAAEELRAKADILKTLDKKDRAQFLRDNPQFLISNAASQGPSLQSTIGMGLAAGSMLPAAQSWVERMENRQQQQTSTDIPIKGGR